jgi:5-oxoprolinase (ATP-hydrolysing) subunit A
MLSTGEVTAVDGSQLAVSMESVCVHGDSPGAVQIAAAVRDRLKAAGTDIEAFC